MFKENIKKDLSQEEITNLLLDFDKDNIITQNEKYKIDLSNQEINELLEKTRTNFTSIFLSKIAIINETTSASFIKLLNENNSNIIGVWINKKFIHKSKDKNEIRISIKRNYEFTIYEYDLKNKTNKKLENIKGYKLLLKLKKLKASLPIENNFWEKLKEKNNFIKKGINSNV
ncbi:hypothetical protein [Spiroplasma endosymbiont of Virgichneumon dumeticola]|uniref:hypothetical protein n=1 Tax=Spiroplasma endosymbiont of Virgichneumon dumeticola TaxID=3139323 RepID=UPI0035C940C8